LKGRSCRARGFSGHGKTLADHVEGLNLKRDEEKQRFKGLIVCVAMTQKARTGVTKTSFKLLVSGTDFIFVLESVVPSFDEKGNMAGVVLASAPGNVQVLHLPRR